MNIKYLILLLFLVSISCSHQEEKKSPPRIILNPESIDHVPLSSLVEDFYYLKLDTVNKQFIGSVNKILISDDKIFVLDYDQSVSLFVYDFKGNPVYTINKYGRGPGEFTAPYDFGIDKKNNNVIIYDAGNTKLSYFNLKNGNFIEDKVLEFIPNRFAVSNDRLIFFMNNNSFNKSNKNIIITDKNLNILKTELEIDSRLKDFSINLPLNFSSFHDHLFLTVPSDYTIYDYYQDNFNEYLYVDFGSKKLPDSFYGDFQNPLERFKETTGSANNISNYFETNNFTFFIYRYKNSINYYLKGKISGKLIHTNKEQLIEDLKIGPLISWPSATSNDFLVWYQQPATLIKYIEDLKTNMTDTEWIEFKKENYKLVSFAQNIHPNDNPYLIFMKIKL